MNEAIEMQPVSALSEEQILLDFVEDCKLRNLSPETIVGYRSRLQKAARILAQKGLSVSRLDKESLKVVLEYLQRQGFAYKNLLQYFAALSS